MMDFEQFSESIREMSTSSRQEESVLTQCKDVAKYLRFNVPCKTAKLQKEKVYYFTGADAVDVLVNSKWSKKTHSTGLHFDSRDSATDFCIRLLRQNLILRCDMIKLDGKNEKTKEGAKGKDSGKNRKKDVTASPKSEDSTKRKKVVVRKYKFELHAKQIFADLDDYIYAWKYNPTSTSQFLMGCVLVLGFIGFNLAPIWPTWMRSGMGMSAWLLCAILGFMLLLVFLRLILFYLFWAVSMGKWQFWLLPNLHEDLGILESFLPFYSFEIKKKKK